MPGFVVRETLSNWLRKRSAALDGARKFAYQYDMSHFLRSIRLAPHLAHRIIQRFLRFFSWVSAPPHRLLPLLPVAWQGLWPSW